MASESGSPDPGRRPRFAGPPPVPGARPAAASPEPAWQAQTPPPPSGTWRPSAPPPPGRGTPAADVAPVAPAPVVAATHDGVEVRARRPIRAKRSSDMAGLLAVFVMLLVAAGGLGYYLLWQQQQEALRALKAAAREAAAVDPGPAAATAPAESPPAVARRRPAKDEAASAGSGALDALVGDVAATPPGDGTPRMTPPVRPAPPTMPAAVRPVAPTTPPEPVPPATPATAPAAVEEALRAAYDAMCGGDFAGAAERLEPLSAGDDEAVRERLERWRRLLHYARGYADLRQKAYAVAGGREYDLGDRVIVVVEIDDERVVYRDSGKQRRLPRDEVPDTVDRAIVEQWLGSDGRAANHLFLGAHHLAKERPSPADATREWRRAASGGEADGRMLEPLVNDPVIVGGE